MTDGMLRGLRGIMWKCVNTDITVLMRQKGLTKPIIEEALEEYSEGTYERLYELVERKYLRYLDGEKGDIKVKNALVRLGYSYDIIKEVLADIKQEYGDE